MAASLDTLHGLADHAVDATGKCDHRPHDLLGRATCPAKRPCCSPGDFIRRPAVLSVCRGESGSRRGVRTWPAQDLVLDASRLTQKQTRPETKRDSNFAA